MIERIIHIHTMLGLQNIVEVFTLFRIIDIETVKTVLGICEIISCAILAI